MWWGVVGWGGVWWWGWGEVLRVARAGWGVVGLSGWDGAGWCPGVHVSGLHRGVLASALTQGRPREDGVHNALKYIPLVINAFLIGERACYLSACVGYYPLGLEVADMPCLLRRRHHLLRERGTTLQGR